MLPPPREQASTAIGSDLEVVSFALQSRDNVLGRLGVVLDQQDAHSTALMRAHATGRVGNRASTCRFRRLRTASDKPASTKIPPCRRELHEASASASCRGLPGTRCLCRGRRSAFAGARPDLADSLAALHHDEVNIAAPLTVSEVALLAVQNDPDLRAARAQHGVAQAQVLQAGLLPNPQVTGASAAAGRRRRAPPWRGMPASARTSDS